MFTLLILVARERKVECSNSGSDRFFFYRVLIYLNFRQYSSFCLHPFYMMFVLWSAYNVTRFNLLLIINKTVKCLNHFVRICSSYFTAGSTYPSDFYLPDTSNTHKCISRQPSAFPQRPFNHRWRTKHRLSHWQIEQICIKMYIS